MVKTDEKINQKKEQSSQIQTAGDWAKQVQDVSSNVLATPGIPVSEAISRILAPFIGSSFKISSGSLIDHQGNVTEHSYGAVIHSADERIDSPISIDKVAVIIDTNEQMGLDELRKAHEKIADAKALKRSPPKERNEQAETQMKMGVIFAKNSTLSLEQISNEMDKLCEGIPSQLWPDMVVVNNQGVISYTANFPGDPATGDFLLPAEKPAPESTPPFYVIRTVKPSEQLTFNVMLGLIFLRLRIFDPNADLPDKAIHQMREENENIGMVYTGYQYNLQGQLVPVPRQFHNDVYLPPAPLFIEDNEGTALGTIQYLPWQEGGVILVKGHFPLDIFYIFLKQIAPSLDLSKTGMIKRDGLQISYVLPINKTDFIRMIRLFEQRSSNMRVRTRPEQFIIQTIGNEGSSSPFVARFMPGMMRLRDMAFFDKAEKDRFDKSYALLHENLSSARESAQEIVKLWEEHIKKVNSGSIVSLSDRAVHIHESIDKELKKELESFVNTAWRTLKNSMQNLANELGVDLGFFFNKESTFINGIKELKKTDPHLADYLFQARQAWTNQLSKVRNDDVEHGTWNLPKVGYQTTNKGVTIREPHIIDLPVTEFVKKTLNRLLCFAEDVTAHCLQLKMTKGINFSEIPVSDRNESLPERFKPTLQDLNVWSISYSEEDFSNK